MTAPAQPLVPRRCFPESLDQTVATLDGIVAIFDIRYASQRCENVVGRAGVQRLCRVLRGEAGHEDPMNQG